MTGKHHTEISKEKNRKAHLGKMTGDDNPSKRIEVRKKISNKNKIIIKNLWNNPDYRNKMIDSHKGKKQSEETIRKRKETFERLGIKTPSRLGVKDTPETIEKKKLARLKSGYKPVGMKKDKHWNWQGGLSEKGYSVDWTATLKRSIRERDRYVCQLCNKPQEGEAHSIHHINYDKLNCNPNNLITLCRPCNAKVNYRRNYWKDYFQKIIKIKYVSDFS
jgi:hypothetical protein